MSAASTTIPLIHASHCLPMCLFTEMNWYQLLFWGLFQSSLSKSPMFGADLCFCSSSANHVMCSYLRIPPLAVMTSHQAGHTTIALWVLTIMAVECLWLKEVGLRSGWIIALSLTFVENKVPLRTMTSQLWPYMGGERSTYTSQCVRCANNYTIPKTILVF